MKMLMLALLIAFVSSLPEAPKLNENSFNADAEVPEDETTGISQRAVYTL